MAFDIHRLRANADNSGAFLYYKEAPVSNKLLPERPRKWLSNRPAIIVTGVMAIGLASVWAISWYNRDPDNLKRVADHVQNVKAQLEDYERDLVERIGKKDS